MVEAELLLAASRRLASVVSGMDPLALAAMLAPVALAALGLNVALLLLCALLGACAAVTLTLGAPEGGFYAVVLWLAQWLVAALAVGGLARRRRERALRLQVRALEDRLGVVSTHSERLFLQQLRNDEPSGAPLSGADPVARRAAEANADRQA